jgi:hypothetical protein
MALSDLVIPFLVGAGILLVVSQRNNAIIAAIDIAAAPDPVKCKAYDDAKVNSTTVNEPCSQVCGTPNVGGDQTKCTDCETVCGVPNCGCFGTNSDPALCDKSGPITTAGCTNPRADSAAGADAEDTEDSEDEDSDDGGDGDSGDNDSGQNAEEYDEDSPAGKATSQRVNDLVKKSAPGKYTGFATVPMNWT